ncbi:MAG: hypothetical protein ACPLYF_04535 [Fervidobacterium sp.]
MTTKYEEKESGYSGALSELIEKGGQLYGGDSDGGCTTVVRGCYVTRFWEPRSAKKGKMIEACETFGYNPYGMTGGSLCRKIIDDILQLPYKNTPFSNTYRKLAEQGKHWHYQYILTGDHGRTIEYDLSSAYMTQFLRLPSMILLGKDEFADDGGAMDKLRTIIPLFPKWLRVQFLGVLASHSRTTITRVKEGNDWAIKKTITPSITYGGAFNAAHRAILRVYRIMEQVHKLAGDDCKRIHTDSFLLSQGVYVSKLQSIFDFLESNGQDVQIKAIGRSCFWDLNEGIIGTKIIGSKPMVATKMKVSNFKQIRDATHPMCEKTWENIIDDIKMGMNDRKSIPINYEKCRLEWNKRGEELEFF